MVRDMGGRSTDSSNPSSSIMSVDGRETKSRLPSVDTATTSCQSSTTSGYASGGTNTAPSTDLNVIEKFPYAVDSDSSDVGNLFQARLRCSGQQV